MTTRATRKRADLRRGPAADGLDEADGGAEAATMSLVDYLHVLWRRRVVVLVVIAAVLGGTWVTTTVMPRSYVADAEVYISLGTPAGAGNLSKGFAYAQGLARSYARVATLPVVLGPVSAQLGTPIEDLQHSVVVQAPADTVLIDIQATDGDRRRAAAVANAVAEQLQVVIEQLSPPRAGQPVPFTLATVSPATVPTFATSPRKNLSMTLAAVLAVLAAVVVAVAVDARRGLAVPLRPRAVVSVPVLGTASRRRWWWWPDRRRAGRVAQLRVGFDRLRTTDRLRVVGVTSTVGGRAFARSVVELASSLSWADNGVLVVDADLRRRAVTQLCDLDGRPGLADALRGQVGWRECLVTGPRPGVCVLPAGRPTSEHPQTLLSTLPTAWRLGELWEEFDLVLVATPPVEDTADGLTLAPFTDGFVVIVDERLTARTNLLAELAAVQLGGSRVLGVVLAG